MTAIKNSRAVTLGSLGERKFLKTLLPRISKSGRSFIVPPGDDAAVLADRSVLSIDGLTERTHFKSSWASRCEKIGGFPLGRGLGWKLMGSALSDLAAMGKTTGRWVMVYLGAPGPVRLKFLQDLQRGVNESARAFDCALAGGDTVRAASLSLVCAVGGKLTGRRALTRGGARPGDLVCVTGTVGDAMVGLRVLENKAPRLPKADAQFFVKRFFRHEPMFDQAAVLSDEKAVTSLIDLSDAVKDTVEIVCAASRAGAAVNVDKIPVSSVYRRSFPSDTRLLSGGEDYALMFTLKPAALSRFRKRLRFSVIGWMRPSSQKISYYIKGKPVRAPSAFEHFA